jgi:hypothetical protein
MEGIILLWGRLGNLIFWHLVGGLEVRSSLTLDLIAGAMEDDGQARIKYGQICSCVFYVAI